MIRPDVVRLDPDSPDNLRHTRVRFAKFGDRAIAQPNWNKLVRFAHIIALQVWFSCDSPVCRMRSKAAL